MDPLTHTLVGAGLARTRLGRLTPLAGAALVIGANLPDVDVVTMAAGRDAMLAHRRGWTHGVLAMALLPLLLTGVLLTWDAWRRRRDPGRPRPRPGPLLLLSSLAVLSHPLLDWMNTYGVRLLMPFDGRWFYGDALFIIDPWLWLVLGGALLLALPDGARRREAGWILLAVLASLLLLGAGPRVPLGAKVAWIAGLALLATLRALRIGRARPERTSALGLLLVLLYSGAMLAGERAATASLHAHLPALGLSPLRTMAGPVPANPFRRDLVVETEDAFRYGSWWALGEGGITLEPEVLAKVPPTPTVEAARRAPWIGGFLGWARFPFVEVESAGETDLVYLLDARYVRRRTSGFGGVVVRVGPGLEPGRP
jgi:inner membrane protein